MASVERLCFASMGKAITFHFYVPLRRLSVSHIWARGAEMLWANWKSRVRRECLAAGDRHHNSFMYSALQPHCIAVDKISRSVWCIIWPVSSCVWHCRRNCRKTRRKPVLPCQSLLRKRQQFKPLVASACYSPSSQFPSIYNLDRNKEKKNSGM